MSKDKHCSACGERKHIDEFHANRNSKDGLTSRCKPCAISAAKAHRDANKEHFKAYDKARANKPERVSARIAYASTESGKASKSASMKKYLSMHPGRAKARTIFGHQLRIGAIVPMPCFVCGNGNTEGHHPDYSRPLDVVWLCIPHHKEVHRMTKEIEA